MSRLGSSEIHKLALEQYRQTEAKINKDHPDLLSSIRAKMEQKPKTSDPLTIDREKNFKAISRFLEFSGSSAGFQDKVRQVLDQSQSG